ncbi:MAG: hypothetical protein E7662_05485 [Ruminococcaceae bacterium]|nr:hypothetical protein [Oscillospiraceae bacterium]
MHSGIVRHAKSNVGYPPPLAPSARFRCTMGRITLSPSGSRTRTRAEKNIAWNAWQGIPLGEIRRRQCDLPVPVYLPPRGAETAEREAPHGKAPPKTGNIPEMNILPDVRQFPEILSVRFYPILTPIFTPDTIIFACARLYTGIEKSRKSPENKGLFRLDFFG